MPAHCVVEPWARKPSQAATRYQQVLPLVQDGELLKRLKSGENLLCADVGASGGATWIDRLSHGSGEEFVDNI